MRSIKNISSLHDEDEKVYVLINKLQEKIIIKDKYPDKDIIYRLHLTSLDDELITLLSNLNDSIELIYDVFPLNDKDISLLNEYYEYTNNKVYITIDITNLSLYDRAKLIYYINRYNVIVLLKTDDKTLYQDWKSEMTKYTSKSKVRRLNNKYIDNKVV